MQQHYGLLRYGKSWEQVPLPAELSQADFTSIAFGGQALATYRTLQTELGGAQIETGGATATVRSEGGDFGEAQLVETTSGSIGSASLPNARAKGFGFFSPENPHHKAGFFWLSVHNGANEQVEPTRDVKSGADNVKGANCDSPTFNYVPSGYDTTVTPVWRSVTAAGSKTGWPICTLTYVLEWDDASTVYGNTEAQQAKQRTVKDFLAYVLGSDGQQVQ